MHREFAAFLLLFSFLCFLMGLDGTGWLLAGIGGLLLISEVLIAIAKRRLEVRRRAVSTYLLRSRTL